jgi:hypothetical protein
VGCSVVFGGGAGAEVVDDDPKANGAGFEVDAAEG